MYVKGRKKSKYNGNSKGWGQTERGRISEEGRVGEMGKERDGEDGEIQRKELSGERGKQRGRWQREKE